AGIQLANLDTTALPGTDFYQYACGGWMKNNPIPAEYSQYGSFTILAENNRKQIQGLIEELAATQHEPGSVAQKIGDLYKIVMDSVKLNKDGVAPIKAELDQLGALKDKKELYALLGEMQKKGIVAYNILYVGADEMNSSMNAVQSYQAGLSMGERDYYLENDAATAKIRDAFRTHVQKMYQLAGFDEAAAKKGVEVVMDVETRLAKAFRSRTELRDPHANYNKMSLEELKKNYPTFDWDAYLSAMDLRDVKEIIIGQPASLKAAAEILDTLPIEQQSLYLQWKLIDAAAGTLNDAMAEQNFDFYERTMSGTQEMQPRWKKAVGTVSSALGEAVGQMYVEKYFPAAAKERMVDLVKNLQESLGERIKNLAWMGDSTKIKALEKLATFHVKIGYPDQWKDYSTLEIKDDSYWANMERANEWSHAEMVAKAGKPVDKDEWLMTPQTVNAYYNPTTNEICFPAGILQPPFFNINADDAVNYGAIGVVIGHEMTHGFDDQGSAFDAVGNMNNWWTDADKNNFKTSTERLAQQFSQIKINDNLNADGHLTLGENIADQGGLLVSYLALQKQLEGKTVEKIDGFTPAQRFFIGYARVWGQNITPEEEVRLTKIDPHSLGINRVNQALKNVDAFYEAFNVQPGDPMYIAPEERVVVW
ncbi:M13 family metallopeptidase, partial [uncultured Porphyromonas sp.]|uniref:M13 family metallopeptidase n=1 Tax=uncultured Porphyromonas sp. TaxID=159274 RepID=UPI002638EF85